MKPLLLRHALTHYLIVDIYAVVSRPLFRLTCASLVIAMTLFGAPATVYAGGAVDREQAIEIAKGLNGGDGKVLGVAIVQDASGNTQYAVKLLSNGRVRVFRVNKVN